ncbi:MAG: AmmeMemoRadiSam system protein B [Candidatus Heimdallarchaeota archaeon]
MLVRQMKNADWMGVRSLTEKSVIEHIHSLFRHNLAPGSVPKFDSTVHPSIVGLISPHAGYACSGPVAAHGYYQVGVERQKADLVIIAGPNHHGGVPFALPPHEAWETPLGTVPIAHDIVKRIEASRKTLEKPIRSYVQLDESAHRHEHSIELQLPFLQAILDEFSILPIGISGSFDEITDPQVNVLSNLVKEAVKEANMTNILVIASTDFTHGNYFPRLNHDAVKEMDQHAIDEILNFSKEEIKLREVIIKWNISMCGYLAVRFVLNLCSELGATKAECLKYATSGETCGGKDAVVGYASICLKR